MNEAAPEGTYIGLRYLISFQPRMAPFSILEAALVLQLVESIFWGIYVCTLGFCLKALLRTQNRWKKSAEISKPMLAVTIVMGCVATFDVFLTFVINLNAFALYDGPGGPLDAINNTAGWMDVMGVNPASASKTR
jgi:hypothetical protein